MARVVLLCGRGHKSERRIMNPKKNDIGILTSKEMQLLWETDVTSYLATTDESESRENKTI